MPGQVWLELVQPVFCAYHTIFVSVQSPEQSLDLPICRVKAHVCKQLPQVCGIDRAETLARAKFTCLVTVKVGVCGKRMSDLFHGPLRPEDGTPDRADLKAGICVEVARWLKASAAIVVDPISD